MLEFDDHGIRGGVWSGCVRGANRPERVCAICRGEVVAEAVLTENESEGWDVTVGLPSSVLSSGVTSLILVAGDQAEGAATQHLGRLNLIAGEVLDQDLGVEIAMLRSEIELLKREFRRQHAGK
ncbi:hypothetical protein PAF17_09715 [Paracoccus sp. Z330]|uniref:Chaperone modulatory protein CbpM n=1 Tax=Paracoccus onchidii TaxID=3017813 RepID=A0ABT4ZET7_9RHOB|nr:hypothetical protein [Paracoccus onchidii]MDB6177777.1 hypothetical protein [Paracoccus onchidii]